MDLRHLPWSSPSSGSSRPSVGDAHEQLTYLALERRASACAEQLSARGIGSGDVVAIMLPNSVALVTVLMGAWRIGAVVTPVDPALTAQDLAYQLTDSGAKLLVTAHRPAIDVELLAPDELKRVPEAPLTDPQISPDALALIMYTAASTKRPRGVVLDHANLRAMSESIRRHLELGADDRSLLLLPLAHVNALCASLLAPISAGGSVSILERFDPGTFPEAVRRHRPTYFSASPAILERFSDVSAEDAARMRSLRVALCSAAPAHAELLTRSESRLGVPVLFGYGHAEATCASACTPLWGERRRGTVGQSLPGQQIVILDDGGRIVPPGVAGEVAILSPTVMRGYHGRPADTAEVLRDGWLRTGDTGILDEDAYLTLVDRRRDPGETLYPIARRHTEIGGPQRNAASPRSAARLSEPRRRPR